MRQAEVVASRGQVGLRSGARASHAAIALRRVLPAPSRSRDCSARRPPRHRAAARARTRRAPARAGPAPGKSSPACCARPAIPARNIRRDAASLIADLRQTGVAPQARDQRRSVAASRGSSASAVSDNRAPCRRSRARRYSSAASRRVIGNGAKSGDRGGGGEPGYWASTVVDACRVGPGLGDNLRTLAMKVSSESPEAAVRRCATAVAAGAAVVGRHSPGDGRAPDRRQSNRHAEHGSHRSSSLSGNTGRQEVLRHHLNAQHRAS